MNQNVTQEIGDIVTQIIGDWPMDVIPPTRPTITRIVTEFVRLAAAAPRTQGSNSELMEYANESYKEVSKWPSFMRGGSAVEDAQANEKAVGQSQMGELARTQGRELFELLKDIRHNSYACAYQQNTFPGDSDPCGQCSPCRIDKVLGEGWETKSDLAQARTQPAPCPVEHPSNEHELPCGCKWARTPQDLQGPIYWNPSSGIVQCHKCGQQFFTALPEATKEEKGSKQ
jgi:hypothetical protein